MGGSVDAVAAVLSAWDYGDETDAAAELDPYRPTASDLGKLSHQLHSAHVGHQHYWLLIDTSSGSTASTACRSKATHHDRHDHHRQLRPAILGKLPQLLQQRPSRRRLVQLHRGRGR